MSAHITTHFRRFRLLELLLSAVPLCAAGTNAVAAPVYTFTDLGPPGGTVSYGSGINNSGKVIGSIYVAGDQHATLWNGTTATDLGTLGGKISYAFGINNSGQVVGSSFIPGNVVTHATLWNGAAGTDLNSFLDAATVSSGWVLTEGHGINDSGWITGVARNSITGQEHAYLLSAVPEPETCALMLAGLGVLGLTVRYRKRATA